MSAFKDSETQERMLLFLCRDRDFLKNTSSLLELDDFKGKDVGPERAWVAEQALEYWKKYGEPIGPFLRPVMQEFCQTYRTEKTKQRMLPRIRERVLELVSTIRRAEREDLVAPEAVEQIIIGYKHRRAKAQFIDRLLDAQEKGTLEDGFILQEANDLVKKIGGEVQSVNYQKTLKQRLRRRAKEKLRKFPYLYIEQLDSEIKTFPRGSMGLIIAKYAMGKSMALAWIARAMALQGYNVLFFTLEDPRGVLEDRLDSMMTGLPIRELHEREQELIRRFKRLRYMMRGRIQIYDGTGGGLSVDRMEEIWERHRNQGFVADVVIIDYDDEIVPPFHYKTDDGRRKEFAEIYRRLRLFASKKDIWLWTAAQTRRGRKGKDKEDDQMVITGDDIAEDISKVRKVGFCLGIGSGPMKDGGFYGDSWGPNSRFLYVAKNKFDRMKIGWPIMGDFDNGLFYDAEATRKKMDEWRTKNGRKKARKQQ